MSVMRRVRAAYYALDLERVPRLGVVIGRHVHQWEVEHGYGDSPKSRATWENEWKSGRWEYLRYETPHYWATIGMMDAYGGDRDYLDVGCGDGLLFERFRKLGYRSFIGFDISWEAIEKINLDYHDDHTHFVQADANVYQPSGPFDVIIMNELIYHLPEPMSTLASFVETLKPDGCVILSTYTNSRRSMSILRAVRRNYLIIDEVTTTYRSTSWICTVIRPNAGDRT